MRTINFRRCRRRHPSTPDISTKKTEAGPFFGESHASTFFQPANAPQSTVVHRQATTEKEEPAIQAKNDDEKKEDPAVMRAAAQEPEDEEKKAQRAVAKEEEEKVSRKKSGAATPQVQQASNYIASLNGKGTALPKVPSYFFAARMGYEFSKVCVHTDSEAAKSAKDINAKAYTVGNHIVFNEGQYNPESNDGKKLLAHELTHVIQQGKGIATKIQCARDGNELCKPSTTGLRQNSGGGSADVPKK